MTKAALLFLSIAALGACGKVAPLTPKSGQSLPVQPRLADHRPDAAELLQYSTEARPARVDEILTRSQPRSADRFDLPPADPALPAAPSAPAAVTTGPDNQDEPR